MCQGGIEGGRSEGEEKEKEREEGVREKRGRKKLREEEREEGAMRKGEKETPSRNLAPSTQAVELYVLVSCHVTTKSIFASTENPPLCISSEKEHFPFTYLLHRQYGYRWIHFWYKY